MDLTKVLRKEYDSSKNWQLGSTSTSIALLVISSAMELGLIEVQLFTLLIITFLLKAFDFLAIWKVGLHSANGEKVRLLVMMENGLGAAPSNTELLKIQESCGKLEKVEAIHLGEYFTSSRPKGPARLLENTAESAFYTSALSRSYRNLMAVGLGISLVLLGVVFIGAISGGIEAFNQGGFAKAIVGILIFVALGDYMKRVLRLHSSQGSCERIMELSLEKLKQPNPQLEEVLPLMTKYSVAVAKGVPTPNWLFNLRKERLYQVWEDYKKRVLSETVNV